MRFLSKNIVLSAVSMLILSAAAILASDLIRPGRDRAPGPRPAGSIRIATLNINGLRPLGDAAVSAECLRTMLLESDVDIAFLQEFLLWGGLDEDGFRDVFNDLYPYVAIQGDEAIVSRFPIVSRCQHGFEGSDNSYSSNDVAVSPSDTVRFFNAHLQTTGLHSIQSVLAREKAAGGYGIPGEAEVSVMKGNTKARKYQAVKVRRDVDGSPYPAVLCGDLNSVPRSWVYRRVKGGMRDTFREKGRGLGATFRGAHGILRIDYVFHDGSFRCIGHSTVESSVSDHRMVVATLMPR